MKRFVRQQTILRLETLDIALQNLASKPEDPEAVHDLRVAIRRFLQCLRVFEDCFDPGAIAKLRRRLRRVLKRCGAVRNCDVTLKLLDTAGVQDVHLKKALHQQRESARQKLVARLDQWQARRATKQSRVVSSGGAVRSALPKMVRKWSEAGDAAAKGSDPKSLHRFRLLGKRLRYTLELFPGLDGPNLNKLRSIQDQLGAINDCVTALLMIQGHPRAEAALTRMLHIRERQFRTSWTRLRKKGEPWKSTFLDTAKPTRATPPNPTKTAS